MDRISKKEEILDAALELFATNGYEATSISQIANAVGIQKASLYFHFQSKQDILDTLINVSSREYAKRSLLVVADFDDEEYIKRSFSELTPEAVAAQMKKFFSFLLGDEKMRLLRRLLVIEQYRNEELSKIQTQRSYLDVLNFHKKLMQFLVDNKMLKDADIEIMAIQFCAPISVWIAMCDRDESMINEILELIDKHVKQFFEIYKY